MFEHDIDAAAIGNPPHLIRDVLLRVVDHLIGAKFPGLHHLCFRSSRGNHPRSRPFRDLDGGAPNAAARAQDQHLLRRLQLRAGDQHVPRREKYQRHGGRFLEGKICGRRQRVHRGRFHVFGISAVVHVAQQCVLAALIVFSGQTLLAVPARHAGRKRHPVAQSNVAHLRAHLGHFARYVAPSDVRQRDLHSRHAAPHPDVQVVQRAGPHAYQHVPRSDGGLSHIRVAQNVRPAMLGKYHRLHLALPQISFPNF